ncbi:MAG TPA: zinc-dependent metalloprotease [Bacteroidia bacterium]|jgi:hypothetical protein|nr:zinc-dependent metalloprotease [Bacteroidia bacterium]
MIKKYLTILSLACLNLAVVAQNVATKNIGPASAWSQTISGLATASIKTNSNALFAILTPNGDRIELPIQLKTEEDGIFTIGGNDAQKGAFNLSVNAAGSVSGYYHSLKDRKAYRYKTDASGNVNATEIAIESLLCMDYTRAAEAPTDEAAAAKLPVRTTAIPKYNSKPDSKFVIYIDLDGENTSSTWGDIYAQPLQSWTDAQVFEIWQVSAQDFLPWDINVTTDRAVYDAQPMSRKKMCIVTSTLDAANGQAIGGIAHIGSFGGSSFDPCWVFNKGVKKTGETVSHEVGHTVGLNHDGYNGSTYYQGHNAWAPIMGAAYSTKTVTIDDANWLGQWSKGEYSGADNGENDLGIIASNGFSLRPDQQGNAPGTAADLVLEADGSFLSEKNTGIIQSAADLDVFKFTVEHASRLKLLAAPYYSAELNRFPNLNIKLRLLDESGTALLTEDSLPPTAKNTWDAMSAAIESIDLDAGTYYIEVDGTKQGTSSSTGYSDYCSIGGFNLSGKITSTVGIQESERISQFNIYPNPSNGIFSITFHTAAKSNYILRVMNTLGQVVYREKLNGFAGSYSNELNTAQFGKGVFIINIADEESSSTRKVVVY